MAHDEERHHHCRAAVPGAHAVQEREQQTPSNQRHQAVRNRNGVEPERQERIGAGNDVGLLPPQQQKHRPEEVGE